MIKVLVVDDHEFIRDAIKRLLASETQLQVIGEAENGEQAIRLVNELKPGIIIMDLIMPGIGGLEATRKILRSHPHLKVVVFTACESEPFPTKLLQLGVYGYISKDCSGEEFVNALLKINAGQHYISAKISQQLALKNALRTDESPLDQLSERELQVMIMITNGQSVQEIAKKLCISPKTVNSYRYRLFDKLKVANDVELTHIAVKFNLINKAVSLDNPQTSEFQE